MGPITEHNLTLFLIQFGLLLGICKIAGYFFEKLKQSSVTAELLVGIILGPTILGKLAPGIHAGLFPDNQVQRSMLETIAWIGNFFLLMETGLEVNFSRIWRQKTQALIISFSDLIIPVLVSFVPMLLLPDRYLVDPEHKLLFALFMSVIMTISALPVAIRGLRDMNILKTDVGFLIISALTINDIVGWVVFTIILGLFARGSLELGYIGQLMLLTLGFTVISLTIVKSLVDKSVSFLHKKVDQSSGLKITFIILLGILFGALTLGIGIHALFGFFIAGVVLGEATHITEKDRFVVNRLVYSIFVPIFFAGIGLHLDFMANFDLYLTLLFLVVGVAGRFLGAWLGAKWSRQDKSDILTIAIAHTPGGQMHIVVAMLAYSLKLINTEVLVAIIASAVLSTIIFGPWLSYAVNKIRNQLFSVIFKPRHVLINKLTADRTQAIEALISLAAQDLGIPKTALAREVELREAQMSTALGKGIAVPHARIDSVEQSYVYALMAPRGIEWDSPDGDPVQLALLLITPIDNPKAQIQILQSLALGFRNKDKLEEFLHEPDEGQLFSGIKQCLNSCVQCQLREA